MSDNTKLLNTSRRRFLRNTGWLATGVTVLAACSPVKSLLPVLPSTGAPEPDDGLLWLQVTYEGRIRFFCPRIEMGQGSVTGLTQVVAEGKDVLFVATKRGSTLSHDCWQRRNFRSVRSGFCWCCQATRKTTQHGCRADRYKSR